MCMHVPCTALRGVLCIDAQAEAQMLRLRLRCWAAAEEEAAAEEGAAAAEEEEEEEGRPRQGVQGCASVPDFRELAHQVGHLVGFVMLMLVL